jgi:hypothetical protein
MKRLRAALDQHLETDSGKEAIELIVGVEKRTEPTALTEGEKGELAECEGIIDKGLGTFYEVGSALLRIREGRLYRPTHSSFERYCQDRWNIGRSYAWRIMGAAERFKMLPSDDNLQKPKNEFQMRPFLKIAPEGFPEAWKRAVKTAKEGRVTTSVVHAVINEMLPNNQNQVRARKRRERNKSKAKLPVGQFLVLINEAKRQLEKGETDKVRATLERIESLLFGS